MYIIAGVLGVIAFLTIVYILLLLKIRKINLKVYRYKKEIVNKENNVLVIYQPSRHKTTFKIVELVKKVLIDKNYGYNIHTLNENLENYSQYKYVVFVAPVYFGEINKNFINNLSTSEIKNLLIIYNGLNKDGENEDLKVKEISLSKYKKIKVHTTDIELVEDFINKEML